MLHRFFGICFEPTIEPDGTVAGPAAPVEPAAPAEPEPWAGVSQEEWQATQERLEQYDSYVQQQQAALEPEPNDEPDEMPDPYDSPAEFAEWVREQARGETADLRGFTEEQRASEGEQRALDVIADNEAREGEFLFRGGNDEAGNAIPDTRQLARQFADALFPAAVERFGAGKKAAEFAIDQACKQARAYEQAVGRAYHERESNQVRTLTGAPRVPAAAGQQAAHQVVIPEGGDEKDVVRRWFD